MTTLIGAIDVTNLVYLRHNMGDMEMIYPDGLKLTFTDEGVVPDIVSLSQCCEVCNDPRMVNLNGIKTCVACHSINHINYGLNDSKPE
jgi:hypothetical protein